MSSRRVVGQVVRRAVPGGGGGGSSTPKTWSFTGDGTATVFTIPESSAIVIANVFVGGQLLKEGTHYTKDSTAKTVTITPAISSGIGIDVTGFTDISVGGGSSIASTDDLPEGATNKYYTDARAIAANSVAIATAQSTANSASTAAANAQSTANSASTAAANAQSTANSASTAAANAQTTATNATLDSIAVSTSAGTITLDFATRAQRMLVGSASFAASKTIALSNAANALVLNFTFQITNVAATLVFPAGFTMQSDDTRWNSGTRTWTPTATGIYEASATYDGTNWKLKISSAFV